MTRISKFTAAVAASFALTGMAQGAAHDGAGSVCADGWSMTDVDGNGYVSKIEMNAYAEAQAGQMDADKSGTVSKEEYVNCNKMALDIPAMERKGALVDAGQLDINADNKISADEYRTAVAERATKARAGDTAAADETRSLIYTLPDESKLEFDTVPLQDVVNRSTKMFLGLDADRSGDLSAEEFNVQITKPIDIDDVLNREFDSADTDASGDLSQTELIAANQKRADDAMQKAETATGQKGDPEVGAPVIYYTYPGTM